MSYLRPKKNLSTKARSRKSEARCARFVGGRTQPASGALPVAAFKGDVKSAKFLIDDKTTNRKSYSIAVKLWQKLVREAFINRRSPALRIEFTDGPTLYVVGEDIFKGINES